MTAQQDRTGAADAVRAIVEPVVGEAGLYLEDVAVTRAGTHSVVRITIDLPEDAVGSLDSDTLGDASRAISAALDADDVVAGAYTLEISTPGTSRPLTELRHFRRARTRLVKLRLHDGATVEGRLVDVVGGGDGDDGEAPRLVLEDGTQVAVADVRKGKVEVELKRLDDAEGDVSDAGESRTDEEG